MSLGKTFYCFVPESELARCRTEGISHGVIPHSVVPRDRGKTRELIKWTEFQWLTPKKGFIQMNDPEGPGQSAVVKGRKEAFRLTIRVPRYGLSRMVRWVDFAMVRQIPLRFEVNRDIGNPADWWIYGGVIPAKWIVAVDRSPTAPAWTPPKPRGDGVTLDMDQSGRGRGLYHPGGGMIL